MKKTKTTFNLATASSTVTPSFENTIIAEKLLLEDVQPTPPSEETIARLNAIGKEYPFCAYLKQNNNLYLL